ncbi:N-6 DNA methylase, partial [Micromonospora sp. NPDC049799]
AEVAPSVLAAWRAFDAAPDGDVEAAGFARAVPVIELLDEDVDLTPARRQPAVRGEASGEQLVRTRERLATVVGDLAALMPQVTPVPADTTVPDTLSVAELARIGALQLIGPIRAASGAAEGGPPVDREGDLVLTGRDVVAGVDASGRDDGRLPERVPLLAGDVVVPVAAQKLMSRVITSAGMLLGGHLYLLRPNPAALDPWFLAGQLRSSANDKQTTSLSGTRIDVRRAQIRRLPLAEQRAHGEAFQRLLKFESAVAEVGSLSAELVRLTADGLAAGTLRPEGGAK